MGGLSSGLSIRIDGVPRPLPRPRVVNGRAISITSEKAKAWRRALEFEIGRAVRAARLAGEWGSHGSGCAYSVTMEFVFLRRSRGSQKGVAKCEQNQGVSGGEVRWMTARPDLDNLAKMVLDAAQSAGMIDDDGQVAELVLRKRVVETVRGGQSSAQPGVLLSVKSLSLETAQELELGCQELECQELECQELELGCQELECQELVMPEKNAGVMAGVILSDE